MNEEDLLDTGSLLIRAAVENRPDVFEGVLLLRVEKPTPLGGGEVTRK
jgi:hypothetical protein